MLAIVSHDAGGAEVLSSFARRNSQPCIFVLEGPALRVFSRKVGAIRTASLAEALHHADSVLCGSSGQSDLEFEAIKSARLLGKRSVCFLDHWANYAARFERSGVTCLPDEIWVGDEYAEVIAKNEFPGLPIRRHENPYFQDIRDELAGAEGKKLPGGKNMSALYVCEPVSQQALAQHGDERHFGYTEQEALRYFLSNIVALGAVVDHIVVRPHPSESPQAYDWAQLEFGGLVSIGGRKPLINEIADCDVVVGCRSMALVVGLLAGKRVVSCIPPGGQPCSLPQAGIEHLRDLIRTPSPYRTA